MHNSPDIVHPYLTLTLFSYFMCKSLFSTIFALCISEVNNSNSGPNQYTQQIKIPNVNISYTQYRVMFAFRAINTLFQQYYWQSHPILCVIMLGCSRPRCITPTQVLINTHIWLKYERLIYHTHNIGLCLHLQPSIYCSTSIC